MCDICLCVVSAPHEWLLNTTLISPQQLEKNQPMLNDASPSLSPPGCVYVCAYACMCVQYSHWHVDSTGVTAGVSPSVDALCLSAVDFVCIYLCVEDEEVEECCAVSQTD